MKIIEILGEDRYPEYTKTAEGCRGILIRGGKILLSYYGAIDQYLIPGGGLESGESLKECCERELREETGVRVDAHTHSITLEEYYHEWFFKSHYFLCDYRGECERAMTENEIKNGLEPRWVDFNEALKIFGSYESYKDTDEMRYGAYYREYTALCEL
ncbi:MAG: NUDIX domain-containing protein [Clostridia bacterium]|nr:NUDIX domain-containing protein [Clostridia bacterium]